MLRNIATGAFGGAVQTRSPGRGLLGAGIGLLAARVATRSVPGAILVGGGLLGKYLWDRKRARNDVPVVEENDTITSADRRPESL